MATAVPHHLPASERARAVDVLATIPLWWERRARASGLAAPWDDWRLALPEPPAHLSGTPVAALADATPTAFGEAYVASLDAATRLREGRHYTPAPLAEVLWQEARAAGAPAESVLDPACGTGSLLLPPLREALSSFADAATALSAIAGGIGGIDLDPDAVWLGNALLAAELLPLWARLSASARQPLPQLLRLGNGLTRPRARPQLVVMNPPYGRVTLDRQARMRWQETLFGHANRYALFLHAAVEAAAPGGVVAALIPTSFLGGSYFQRLRAFLAAHAPLVRLTFVDARSGVFAGDVLQETCLAVFRKSAMPASVACSRIRLNGSAELTRLPETPLAVTSGRPWLLPRRPHDARLVHAAANLTPRLSDYGWRASTGPLVWNRHKSQISSSAEGNRVPIVWGADLEDGRVRRNRLRDGQRWIALRERDEFMRLTQPAILVQRTTAPEQRRRLLAARLDADTIADWGGSVVVENHVNVLRCSDLATALTPTLLERLLQTETFDRLYRCLTGTVAVSAYELEALPLPPHAILLGWQELSCEDLPIAVSAYYDDDDS